MHYHALRFFLLLDNGGGPASVTFDQFKRAVTLNGYPTPTQAQYNSFIQGAGPQGKISTKQELAMALAQFLHESDGLRAKREYACANTNCPGSYRYTAKFARLDKSAAIIDNVIGQFYNLVTLL